MTEDGVVCVEAQDFAASKLVANREKDREFVRVLIAEEIVQPRRLLQGIAQLTRTLCQVELIERSAR